MTKKKDAESRIDPVDQPVQAKGPADAGSGGCECGACECTGYAGADKRAQKIADVKAVKHA
ncbi:MAG: hypothetical protein GY906_36175 [bacterium]|nr:hypothetical protein [bacterium]